MENNAIPVEQHPLQPFLPPNGRILMLGSFPPQQKRWAKGFNFFYPNFSNDMWRVMGLVFFGERLRLVDEAKRTYRMTDIVELLETKGIGLYDTACEVRRLQDNASDKFLEVVRRTDIEALLQQMPLCHTIVTTGQKATETMCEHYGVAQPPMGGYSEFELEGRGQMRLYRMPSTSRAYPLSIIAKAEAYGRMFDEVLGQNETI